MAPEKNDAVQLQAELQETRQRLAELETVEHTCQVVEGELRRQNTFFQQVLESLTHPFYVLDANDYHIIVANSAARLGSLTDQPTCYALTHRRTTPCDGTEHICPLQVVKKTKQPVTVEHIHYDKDGNPRDMEVHAYPIFDDQGQVVQMIEYSLDITDRKRLEKEIREYADKIKRFAYSISHDLKNPLIAINGLTNLLQKQYRERLDDKGRTFCEQIVRESRHAINLIEEINAFIKAKETPLSFAPIDVKEILAQIREEFQTPLTNRQIQWSEPEVIPEVVADRSSLLRAFRNYIDNALKYGGPNLGQLQVKYESTEDFHIFSVCDDGVGLAADQLEKIFGAFERGDYPPEQEGTGLGLAIVQEIAQKHGGRAWAKPNPHRGLSFFISLSKKIIPVNPTS